jgi:hypothetical protein
MPSFESLALRPEQRCNKVFNAIIKTLLHNRNQWMTAMQLVGMLVATFDDKIRSFFTINITEVNFCFFFVDDCRKLDLAQLRCVFPPRILGTL